MTRKHIRDNCKPLDKATTIICRNVELFLFIYSLHMEKPYALYFSNCRQTRR
nr:MAG TPA: hypothetical protein [Caudoviricetes sp.]